MFVAEAQFVGWGNAANNGRTSFGANINTAGFNDAVWHATQIVVNAASSSFNFDGASNATSPGTNAPSAAIIAFGGLNNTCTSGTDGKMTEAGVWPVAFSGANITALNANAHAYPSAW